MSNKSKKCVIPSCEEIILEDASTAVLDNSDAKKVKELFILEPDPYNTVVIQFSAPGANFLVTA